MSSKQQKKVQKKREVENAEKEDDEEQEEVEETKEEEEEEEEETKEEEEEEEEEKTTKRVSLSAVQFASSCISHILLSLESSSEQSFREFYLKESKIVCSNHKTERWISIHHRKFISSFFCLSSLSSHSSLILLVVE
jgi:cation transport ATPase